MTSRRRFQPAISNHPKPKGRPTHYPRVIQESRFLSNLPVASSIEGDQVWLSSRDNSIFFGQKQFQWLSGCELPGFEDDVEINCQQVMPGPATFKRITVAIEEPLSGGTIVFTLRVNGNDSALKATIPDGQRTASGSAFVKVFEGDLVSIGIDIDVGVSQKPNIATWFTPGLKNRFYYVGGRPGSGTRPIAPQYGRGPAFTFYDAGVGLTAPLQGTNTEMRQYSIVSTPGRIRTFKGQFYGTSIPSGQSFTMVIMRGFESNEKILAELIFNSGESEKAIALDIPVSRGELICVGFQESAINVDEDYRHAIVFEPDKKGWFMLGNGFASGFGFSEGTEYSSWAHSEDFDDNEALFSHVAPVTMEMRDFLYQSEIGAGGPGDGVSNGASFIMRSRIRGVNGNLLAEVVDAEEETSALNFLDTIEEGQEFGWSCEAVGDPNDDHFTYSVSTRVTG